MKVSELQINNRIYPVQNTPQATQKAASVSTENSNVKSFSQVLQDTLQESQQVKFSAHAVKRLEERQVDMSVNNLERLNEGVKQLDAKGSTNSVILMDDTAFVVSVKNKTVVTAVDKSQSTNNVFTNIDSLAIV